MRTVTRMVGRRPLSRRGQRAGRLATWAARIAAAVALAAALAALPRALAIDGARVDRLTGDVTRAHATIASRKAALTIKRRRVRALKTSPRVIEDIARDDLGMIYPGELVLRVERAQRSLAHGVSP
jgi:cell division protein FtsB